MPCDALKAQERLWTDSSGTAERGLVVDLPVWVGPMCSTATKADGAEVGERRKARNSRCVSEMI